MKDIAAEIESAMQAKYPLIYVHTAEEDRIMDALRTLVKRDMPKGSISVWTSVAGLDSCGAGDTVDPVKALCAILKNPHDGFYVMKDLAAFMKNPDLVRVLRDAYYELSKTARSFIIIMSPVLFIPDELERELTLVDVPLPTTKEYMAEARRLEREYPDSNIPDELYAQVAMALRGLTLREAGHVMHGVLGDGNVTRDNIFSKIFSEKEKSLRKFGVLQYIPNRVEMENIGGLDVLRDWVMKRKDLFTQEAADARLPVPKGVLIMGVSGCGKSMCCKAVASLWNVPLFRLDMNMVFSGMYGNPHAAFHRALSGIESVAPAVLWIDEVENALGMTTTTHTSEQTLTFSSFLTWMQERPPLVFVAATANRIESLPAEIIRKGRFDEVFFCDLPTEEERRAIIEIHLKLNGVDRKNVDPGGLLYLTREWSGAEIEQAVVAAKIEAHHEGRSPTLDDIKARMREMVPLSTTMAEQIRAIREWSRYRAKPASKLPPRSMMPA
jgi:hypothetical protein